MNLTEQMSKTLASDAITHFWQVRKTQTTKQMNSGITDQGFRGAVTGGAQMNGFINAFVKLANIA